VQSHSRALTADGLVNGNRPFSTPTESMSLNWSAKHCHRWLCPRLLLLLLLLTARQIFTLDGSYDADSCKAVPLLAFIGIAAHLWRQIAPKPQFWGRFSAKRTKYRSVNIIETATSIKIKFCTVIEITKYFQWVVHVYPKLISDGRWLPSWKIEKSQYFSNRFQ